MKILVVNAWHDDNRGDQALVNTTISLLKKRYPTASMTVMSMISAGHPYWEKAHQSTKKQFPDIKLLTSPFPLDAAEVSFRHYWALLIALISIFVPRLALSTAFRPAVEDADLVVAVGGHYFFTLNNNFRSLFRLLRLTLPLSLAAQLNKKNIIFSQSLGPYHGWLATKLMRRVLAQCSVYVREALSEQLVKTLAPSANVVVKPDSAFLLGAYTGQQFEAEYSGRYGIITLREPMKGDVPAVRRRYLATMKQVAMQLIAQGDIDKLLVFPHVIGPTALEDDRAISQAFVEMCAVPGVELADSSMTVERSLEFYRHARFVIGTRFHSVVFALCQGTPAVAIAYYGPKAQGIMRYIGMADYCFDLESFQAAQLVTAVNQVIDTRENAEQIRQKMLSELLSINF